MAFISEMLHLKMTEYTFVKQVCSLHSWQISKNRKYPWKFNVSYLYYMLKVERPFKKMAFISEMLRLKLMKYVSVKQVCSHQSWKVSKNRIYPPKFNVSYRYYLFEVLFLGALSYNCKISICLCQTLVSYLIT